jgi:hypothetical protein
MNGPDDLVRGLILSLDNTSCLAAGLFVPFLSVAKNSMRNNFKMLFSSCFGLFILNEWSF